MTENRKARIDDLAKKLGVCVKDYALWNEALSHPSYVADTAEPSNQRLEFLGDAVVDLIIGEYLFHNLPDKNEGELTKMRAALVCESALAEAAKRVQLGDYLLLGRGELHNGGDKRDSTLADAWESVMAAIYLSDSINAVRAVMLKYLQPEIVRVKKGFYGDYKTQLQELIQRNPQERVEYRIIAESGPDHAKEFTAQVLVNGRTESTGIGKTKKEAEQKAALAYLEEIGELI